MSNHLFIGLGGTGCAVVRELKKLLFCEWKRRGNQGACPSIFDFEDQLAGDRQRVRIATLSVDSNEGDLNGRRDQRRVLGEEISLRDNEKVLISPVGLSGVMDNLNYFPGIEPWVIGEREHLEVAIRGADRLAGCNQIRKLGRLALANGNNLNNVLAAVNERRRFLIDGGDANVTIHISCTLGCGTGSGILIDTIAQIKRALHAEAGKFSIYLYLFATSGDVGDINTGNFYANQYAALQELNALQLGIYRPWDIQMQGHNQEASRLSIRDPFETAFIITDATENGQGLTLPQQISSVAELAFQTLVRLMGHLPTRLNMAFSFEDVAAFATDEPGSDRSIRFASFGVKRWAIPEEEIHGKLTYTFVAQGMARMLYNNWNGRYGEGYASVPTQTFSEDVFVDNAKLRWGITAEQLNNDFERPDPESEPFPKFVPAWGAECENSERVVKARYPKSHERWISEFDEMCRGFYQNAFRGRGVEAYFRVRMEPSALRTRAERLATNAEQDLIDGMLALREQYLVSHFPDVVLRAITHLRTTRKQFADELLTLTGKIEQATEDRETHRLEMEELSFIRRKLFGKEVTIFSSYVNATKDYYSLETARIAGEYAVALIDLAMMEFNRLKGRAAGFANMLQRIHESRTNLATNLLIRGNMNGGASREVQYYVNFDEINASVGALTTNKVDQDTHALQLVERLKSLNSGGNGGFARWMGMEGGEQNGGIGGRLVEEIDKVASRYVVDAHEEMRFADSGFAPILRQNIVGKLYRDHGGMVTPQLEAKVRGLMESAMPAVKFDGGAVPVGHHGVTSPIFGRTVFLPECDEYPEFRNELRNLIQTMVGGGAGGATIAVEVADVPAGRNCSEIVFLAVAYFFPLRMLNVVQALHTRHAQRMTAAPLDATFQIYTESHRPALPGLLRLSQPHGFEAERGMASVLAEVEEAARESGVNTALPRFLQARLFVGQQPPADDASRPLKRFRAGAVHGADVHIGPISSDRNLLRMTAEFPMHELPQNLDEYKLVVDFAPLSVEEPAQRATLVLPRHGASNACRFTFRVPPDATHYEARIIVSYRNRVLQTARLGGVTNHFDGGLKAEDEVGLRAECLARGRFSALQGATRFASSFIFNDTAAGRPAVTTVNDRGVWVSTNDGLPELAELFDNFFSRLADKPADYMGAMTAPATGLLCKLAINGHAIYQLLNALGADTVLAQDLGAVQVFTKLQNGRIPVEFVYQSEKSPNPDAAICPDWQQCIDDRACKHPATHEFFCPSRFWGLSRVIERHGYDPQLARELKPEFLLQAEPVENRVKLVVLNRTLLGGSQKVNLVMGNTDGMDSVLQAASEATGGNAIMAHDWKEWREKVKQQADSLLMIVHTEPVDGSMVKKMEISGDDSLHTGQVDEEIVGEGAGHHPMVLLLGCHTGTSEVPFEALTAQFKRKKAAIVLGTGSLVHVKHAVPFMKLYLRRLRSTLDSGDDVPFGEFMRRLRVDCMKQGLLLALALTAYGDADWILSKPNTEPAPIT